MPKHLEPIQLQPAAQGVLQDFVSHGKRSTRAIKRAQVLLRWHEGQSPQAAGQHAGVSLGTVYHVYHRYRAEGVDTVLTEKPRSGQPPKLQLRQQAALTTLACSQPPAGQARWSVRLLADQAVEVGIVEHIAPETVRQFLKKTS